MVAQLFWVLCIQSAKKERECRMSRMVARGRPSQGWALGHIQIQNARQRGDGVPGGGIGLGEQRVLVIVNESGNGRPLLDDPW